MVVVVVFERTTCALEQLVSLVAFTFLVRSGDREVEEKKRRKRFCLTCSRNVCVLVHGYHDRFVRITAIP